MLHIEFQSIAILLLNLIKFIVEFVKDYIYGETPVA